MGKGNSILPLRGRRTIRRMVEGASPLAVTPLRQRLRRCHLPLQGRIS